MTKDDIKITLIIVAVLGFFMYLGGALGYMRGYSVGADMTSEIHRESDCRFDYGWKPVSEVPARCAKYFDLEIGGEE